MMCNQAVRTVNSTSSQLAKASFPIQQLPGAALSKIENLDGTLAAFGALVRCSNNQAYFIIEHLDETLTHKAVVVSTPDANEPLNLRIDEVHHNPPERLIIEHLVDNLAETTMGRHNLELKKNITIDLFDSDNNPFLRDRAGFFVTDRQQFRQLLIQASEALTVLKDDDSVVIEKFQQDEITDLVDYDNTLSAQTRPDFLKYMTTQCKVYVAKPRNAKKPPVEEEEEEENSEKLNLSGYLVAGAAEQRVLCLYAQTQEIADALLRTYLQESKVKTVTLCSIRQHWPHLVNLKGTEERSIYRRHTRSVPSSIKWERIFGVNIGTNLF